MQSRKRTRAATKIALDSLISETRKNHLKVKAEVEDLAEKNTVELIANGTSPDLIRDIVATSENNLELGPESKKRRRTRVELSKESDLNEQPSYLIDSKQTQKDIKVSAEDHKPKPSPRKRRLVESTFNEGEDTKEGEDCSEKPKRKRKTKEEKEAEAMPLAARSVGLRMFVGAHVSAAKGVHNAVTNCVHIGGNAFALFTKSQRKWESPPLQEDHKAQFRALTAEHKYDATSHILPHGSYLVNLAQEDPTRAAQAYTAFLEDLHRCEALGIKLYNFHPGATGGFPRSDAIARIATHLNAAHAATKTIIPLLETMAGGGTVVGATFADLRDIINLVRDKARVGVCLDTCHVFAAGYDLRSSAAFRVVLHAFDDTVGLRYLKALHLNDSKTPLGSRRDLHANIGTGFLGLRAFWNVMNESCFEGLPMVLETPIERPTGGPGGKIEEDKGVWAREIKLLEGLVGMDIQGEEFRELEMKLADEGAAERAKHLEQFERKTEKERRAGEKGKRTKKRKKREGKEKSESEGSC